MAENSVTIWGLAEGHKLRPATEEQVRGIAAEQADRAIAAAGVLTTAQVEEIARRIARTVLADSSSTADPNGTPMPTTEARRTIILGDSHSDWFWPQAGGVWWWQTAADLAGLTIVDNVAVGGMTTRDALKGWSTKTDHPDTPQIEQAEKSDADLVMLEFGGNDMTHDITTQEFRENLTEIVTRLQKTGKRVLIVAPPPLFPEFNKQFGTQYEALRKIDQEVATALGAYYTDGWDLVGTGPGGSLPGRYDSGDGVHMNSAGQLAYGQAVAARVQQVAGVKDPYDGTRDQDWYRRTQGDTAAITVGTGPADPLFKGTESALIVSRSADVATEDAVIFQPVSAEAGSRWELSFAYRVEGTAYPGTQASMSWSDWPAGTQTGLRGQLHSVGQEGVRRVETTIPQDATGGRVFSLRVRRAAGDLRVRVGALGLRKIE